MLSSKRPIHFQLYMKFIQQ